MKTSKLLDKIYHEKYVRLNKHKIAAEKVFNCIKL